MTMSRRLFLAGAASSAASVMAAQKKRKAAAPGALPKAARVAGANERIRIGIIGCGERGFGAHMTGLQPYFESMNIEIVAVCDAWRLHRERAAAKVKEWTGREPAQFGRYRDLLAMKDLDAVTIATPDHLHTTHLEAAALAKKHIYVEKPMGMEMDKLVRAFDAAKAAGTVIQVGTQLRSIPAVGGAREVFKSGILGKVSRVEECRNGEKPYWYRRLDEAKPEDVEWAEFLGDRPMRPFDSRAFTGWYGYYEFSQGPVPQWGAHFIDLMHYVMGCGFPESCVCLGGVFTFKDENKFTAPDHVQALWTYPEGFMVSYSTNFGNGFGASRKFYGDKGVMKMENWSAPVYTAEGGARRDGSIRGINNVKPVEGPDHFLNWLQSMRKMGTPIAPLEAGFQHSVATIMAMESYNSGRRVKYDAEKRALVMA